MIFARFTLSDEAFVPGSAEKKKHSAVSVVDSPGKFYQSNTSFFV